MWGDVWHVAIVPQKNMIQCEGNLPKVLIPRADLVTLGMQTQTSSTRSSITRVGDMNPLAYLLSWP